MAYFAIAVTDEARQLPDVGQLIAAWDLYGEWSSPKGETPRLIAGMPAKVNLIPFNPWPGSTYEPSGKTALERFAGIVNAAGFAAPIRTPRGQDILAACGQLRTESRRERAGG